MTDKSELLRELRIDRNKQLDHEPRGNARWWISALVILLTAGTVWLALAHPSATQVKAVVAQASPSGQSGGGVSILDASGYVMARRQATVSAKITGKLDQLFIEEGQHVKADEILARLDDTNSMAELLQAKAAVIQAEAAVAQARVASEDIAPTYLRNQKQAAAGLISTEALDTSKANYDTQKAALLVAKGNLAVQRAAMEVAQRNEDDTVVRAPYSGVITSKNAQPGEIISPLSAGGAFTRSGIGTLVDMESLEVDVDVNENFISRVHADAPAVLRLNAYQDWQIPAYVIAVVPTADRSKATVKVRVGFKIHDPRILPEMGARVAFIGDSAKSDGGRARPAVAAVLLPSEAVQPAGGVGADTGVVFVLHDTTVERRVVKLGSRHDDQQTVLSGLSAGDRVAVGDFTTLVDGAHVKVNTR